MPEQTYHVIVIGAGAAGLLAAGRAAENGAKVLLVEKMKQEGRKLLITGKGRCNITNQDNQAEFIKHIYPNGRFLKHVFSKFFSKEIIQLLNDQGVETNVERGGRYFPVSNNAADVLKALLQWVKSNDNVEILCGCKLADFIVEEKQVKGVEVEFFSNGKKAKFFANKVVVCMGGNSYPATGSSGEGYELIKALGHKIEPIRPALVPIETEGDIAEKLQGLSLKNVKAMVWVNGKKMKEDFGEMLFTHFGLSGPIILTLSRTIVDELRANNTIEVSVDLKPALDDHKLDNRLIRELDANGKKRIDNICKQLLPTKMIPVILELAAIDPSKQGHQINAKERKKLRVLLKELRFKVIGHRSFKEAIITAGGVNTSEVYPKTMESKIIKNLYFAGEILDLDADTGGYNLQIAFSTGWMAGDACVE